MVKSWSRGPGGPDVPLEMGAAKRKRRSKQMKEHREAVEQQRYRGKPSRE